MWKIELNKKEYEYLCLASFLEDRYKTLLRATQIKGSMYFLTVSENEADDIRDLCGERLQIVGLDKDYELTEEGRILESLVDKFYID
jgi:hypothetical protein